MSRTLIAAVTLVLGLVAPAAAQEGDDPGEPVAAAIDAPAEVAPTLTGREAEADPARAELMSPDEATASLVAQLELSPADRAAYAAALRDFVKVVRGKVLDEIAGGIEAKQAEKMDRFSIVLSIIAWAGLLLLFMPLLLRKRYPGRGRVTLKYSALSALLFFLTINLFAVVLLTMRGAQGALGRHTNPQIKIVEATFDLIEDKAEDMASIGPMLIEPTLASLRGDTDEPVVSIMLANVQRLRSDFTIFSSVGRFFQRLDWLTGQLPLILMAVALFLFFKAAQPTLVAIVRLPERAAQGEAGVGRQVARTTLRNVWAEAKATFCVVAILIALSLLAGALLGRILQPAIEIFMAYLTLSFMYIQLTETASSFWVLFSLMGTILFLLLNLGVVVVVSALFLAKVQKVFQQKFRHGVPLASHAGFWKWGGAGAVWAQLLPLLYIVAALPAIGWLAERSLTKFVASREPADQNWAFVLGSGPALFLVTFVLVFWLFRGMRAIGFLATYKVSGEATAAVGALDDAMTGAAQPTTSM